MAEDIIAMVETLDRGTLRDRAMLPIGFAGGPRRSEIVGLDLKADQTEDGRGWVEPRLCDLGRTYRARQCGQYRLLPRLRVEILTKPDAEVLLPAIYRSSHNA